MSTLKLTAGYYSWDKGEDTKLSEHFSTTEFDCQCKHDDCVEQKLSQLMLTKLERIRVKLGFGLIVTSGFRCAKHQEYIRNSGVSTVVAKQSSHEKGDAVDIKPVKMENMPKLYAQLPKEFEAIGLSDAFFHCDLRTGKKRRWNY